MHRPSLRFALLAPVTVGIAACADPTGAPTPAAPTAPDGVSLAAAQAPIYLVTFRDGVTDVPGAASEIARARGFALRFVREHAARGFSAVIPPSQLDAVRGDPRVLLVERDGPVSLIEPIREAARPGGGGGAQSTPWGITRVGGPGDGTGKTAWIIDTGIDLDHPDLNTSRNCHVDFIRADNGGEDGNGHGTHVAGTIASPVNGTGISGVAPEATLVNIRAGQDSGYFFLGPTVDALTYAAQAHIDVVNMSFYVDPWLFNCPSGAD